jgi:thiol-disulfide isomerase/thioredoxin
MNKNKIIWLGIVVFLVVGIIWLVKIPSKSGKLDAFATCIKDSGAIFYGAFWCPHCQNQKAMFGASAKLLPYVECSTPDGNSQLPICIDAGVESYPTWEYADGTRETGEISLERLSEKTACPLSQEEING